MENLPRFEGQNWPEDLFEENDIVAVGEHHGRDNEAIIALIEKFSSKIDAVFYEEPISLQPSIDLYLETGEISDDLESLFKGAEKEGKNIRDGMLKILSRLRDLNIKVICIDSSKVQTDEYKTKSDQGYYFLKGESRDEDMFDNIMNHYQVHPGKYIVVCGAAHLAEGMHFSTGKETLGTKLKNVVPEKSQSFILS